MGPAAPIPLFIFFSLFQDAGAVDPTHNLARPLGSSVDFSIVIPEGARYTKVVLRSATKGQALVLWAPQERIQVMSSDYSGRIVLSEKANAFRILNLTMADAGDYQVSLRSSDSFRDTLLKTYTLFVFHINVTTKSLTNNSCSLYLLCEAGTGRRTVVTYSWKEKETGVTLSHNSWLRILVSPGDEKELYTCTAQARGIQSALSVGPYECCPHNSAAAGSAIRGPPSRSRIATAVLVPAALALLLLL